MSGEFPLPPEPTPAPAEPDEHPVFPWLTRPRRVWLYGIVGTVEPLLIAQGITQDNTGSLWAAVILSVLSTGIVIPNTLRR